MPLPDERHSKSVASLIGRFEQQTKKQLSPSPGPRSSSVASHTTGDSAKEEVKERREWPPRTSNVTSPPNGNEGGRREWAPRLSSQTSGDSAGQRWPPVQPIIQASPFSDLKKSPTSPLAKGSELAAPAQEQDDKPPSPPAETPEVITIIPPSREATLTESEPPKSVEPEPPKSVDPEPPKPVDPEPPKPVDPEPAESPQTPLQPTTAPPTTKPGPSPATAKPPSKTVKATSTKSNAKATGKPPPSSFAKGTPLQADANDRRSSTSAHPPPRPTSRTNLRSKTPVSTPGRPPSSAQRKPPTETPKHTPTQVRRSKTPINSPRQLPSTPSKPPPVIPKTPNSRLYAPTAASLAKSANSPQPPPPERKKTLSSGASLERLSKPTASSLSKSKSTHSLTSSTSPPKSKPTPTRMGTLNSARKSTTMAKPSQTNPASPTQTETSAQKDVDAHGESRENGNGIEAGLLTTEQTPHPETKPLGAENHESEPEVWHEHVGNGSLEASYTEEPSEDLDESRAYGHDDLSYSSVDQDHVEEPEELVRSHSPESGAEGPTQESADGDIADIVGLLESTSFTSKHILHGSDEGVANPLLTPSPEKERQKIGEIPDEE